MRYMGDGTPVTSVTVAVNPRLPGAEGAQGDETWRFRDSCWRRLAETTNQYLRKGSPVMVIGEVDASAYIPREGGEPRATLELTAREVKFLPRGGTGTGEEMGAGMDYATDEEDIPF